MAKLISRDKKVYIDYIPIQIDTEYRRYLFKSKTGATIDGVIPLALNKQLSKPLCFLLTLNNVSTRMTQSKCNVSKSCFYCEKA